MTERDTIESAWRGLISSATGRDPVESAAALADGIDVGLLQTAGPSALLSVTTELGRRQTAELVDALAARGWYGDDVLAELLTATADGSTTGRVGLRVDLDMLGDVLDDPRGGYLDLGSGDAWPADVIDDGQVEGLDPDEDPDPALWLYVLGEGSRPAYRDMVDFADRVTDPRAHDDLVAALDGRGAFRRFQSALDRHERYRVHWRVFSAERRTGRARAWLAEQGYDAVP